MYNLCLSFSSLNLSKIVFPSNTDLSKAPDINVISQTSLLPKFVLKSITQNILFSSLEMSPNFCTLTNPLFSKLTT